MRYHVLDNECKILANTLCSTTLIGIGQPIEFHRSSFGKVGLDRSTSDIVTSQPDAEYPHQEEDQLDGVLDGKETEIPLDVIDLDRYDGLDEEGLNLQIREQEETKVERAIRELETPTSRLWDSTLALVQDAVRPAIPSRVFLLDPLYLHADEECLPPIPPKLNTAGGVQALFCMHHTSPQHWTLVILHFETRAVSWYDPLRHPARTRWVRGVLTTWAEQCLPGSQPVKFTALQGPQQTDGHNCGIFVLKAMLFWLRFGRMPSVCDPLEARRRFADLIRPGSPPLIKRKSSILSDLDDAQDQPSPSKRPKLSTADPIARIAPRLSEAPMSPDASVVPVTPVWSQTTSDLTQKPSHGGELSFIKETINQQSLLLDRVISMRHGQDAGCSAASFGSNDRSNVEERLWQLNERLVLIRAQIHSAQEHICEAWLRHTEADNIFNHWRGELATLEQSKASLDQALSTLRQGSSKDEQGPSASRDLAATMDQQFRQKIAKLERLKSQAAADAKTATIDAMLMQDNIDSGVVAENEVVRELEKLQEVADILLMREAMVDKLRLIAGQHHLIL